MKYIKNRYVIFALCLILAGVIAFVIVVMQKFTEVGTETNKALYEMDNSEQLAISVTLANLASSVSGKIQPGDVVSVYGFINETKQLADYTDLQYIEVIGVSNSSAEESSSREFRTYSPSTRASASSLVCSSVRVIGCSVAASSCSVRAS